MFNNRTIQIIGLGYVGLPLALATDRKYKTLGVDRSATRLDEIRTKTCIVEDCTVKELLDHHTINLTDRVSVADIHIICLPTPVDEHKSPDISILKSALENLRKVLRQDDLLIIESTIYPGMIEELRGEILKDFPDLRIAHCPERINPGDKRFGVLNIDRVCGGLNDETTHEAAQFYRTILDDSTHVLELKSVRSAEACKVLENIFRDVNIALINEMAQAFYRMGIDTFEVIRAASTKPFAFMPHYPGIGVGGHCIAVDPYYMIQKGVASGFDHEFLRMARKINENMPTYTAYFLQNALNYKGLAISSEQILVLGLSYKANVSDDRESPSYPLIKKLTEDKNAAVKVFDPHIPNKSDFETLGAALGWASSVVLCTAHSEFLDIDWSAYSHLNVVLDGRGMLKSKEIACPRQKTKTSFITIGDGKWDTH